jgi:hypothetical protein
VGQDSILQADFQSVFFAKVVRRELYLKLMLTFEQFLHDAAGKGGAVNLMFEERLFGLVEILHRVADMFMAEHVPYELIGGMAVAAQMELVDRDAVMLTRDVDVMIHRSDLERVKESAARHGFHFRHTAGLDMLLYGEEKKAVKGVHLVFSGECVKANQAPNPPIAPERITLYGKEVSVVPVVDLVRMKLNAFRDKDRVHVRAMDEIGLITPEVEGKLSAELRSRLGHVRETE